MIGNGERPELELLLRDGVPELLALDFLTRSALEAGNSCSGVDDETINDVDVSADSSIGAFIASGFHLSVAFGRNTT